MEKTRQPDRWSAVAALGDRSRRALYGFVRTAGRPVTREDAAEATGISRGLAAFHLDKMVEAGLLTASYEAPAGQPRGRGRTPKVYQPAGDDIAVTVPERRYELIAEILADAVADDPTRADDAARRQAHRHGRDLAAELGPEAELLTTLDDLGFSPECREGGVVLRNCPFHGLVARHTELVCGLNHAFLAGLVEGIDAGVDACLQPHSGACCVQLHPHST
ncbi:MAG TPA: helix-turn-helix domain-containing protein [Micromonosporaceae bacterium]|nr:helix-turn-helix domain-containing protein [Micromonosporaceae bacterium]